MLIVDDDEGERENLRDGVEMMALSALMAANAEDALDMLEHSQPCLVILDVRMHGLTGTQMLERMQQNPSLVGLPVVMSTSPTKLASSRGTGRCDPASSTASAHG